MGEVTRDNSPGLKICTLAGGSFTSGVWLGCGVSRIEEAGESGLAAGVSVCGAGVVLGSGVSVDVAGAGEGEGVELGAFSACRVCPAWEVSAMAVGR